MSLTVAHVTFAFRHPATGGNAPITSPEVDDSGRGPLGILPKVDSDHPDAGEDRRRVLLREQLAIVWRFAERFVMPRIDLDVCLWEPGTNVCTVREVEGSWRADWPDEDKSPLAEPTVGWLLWHIEWWWTNAARALAGLPPVEPGNHHWSASVQGVLDAKSGWDTALAGVDLDAEVTGLMPTARPAAFVAAWVNFELTKNIAEIHQLLTRRDNIVGPTGRVGP